MPLTGKTAEEIEELEKQLLSEVPEDGTSIGNKRLRVEKLKWEENLYLSVRKRLIDDGVLELGRGKGGSVRRLASEDDLGSEDSPSRTTESAYATEETLYPPMAEVIRARWVDEQPFDQVLVENTARGGRRRDGIWSRPDVTVAAMTSFTFVPGRHFDVVTFEIKHYSGISVTAVYEALSHRRAGTKAYVLVYIPDEELEALEVPTLQDVHEECSRHGIGLVVASDPADFDTWDTREEAIRIEPDPAKMNTFIRNQLSEGTRDQIVRWFR